MLIERVIFSYICRKANRRRHKSLRVPDDIECKFNMSYGQYGKWNLLDVYYPRGTSQPLPTIVNIHGGGYVYGTKEESKYYCMDLARRGFAVVNFSYRLAPKIKFPVAVIETNAVMQWVCANAAEYFIDLNNIFFTGDSAGAQIASQYSAMITNPEYAGLFDIAIPRFKLRAVALNCGMYDAHQVPKPPLSGLIGNYFGKDHWVHGDRIDTLKYVNKDFPPAFIASAVHDFLLSHARPMFEFLQKKGIESVYEVYGSEDQKKIGHVFNLDILSPEAQRCTERECAFFRRYVG